MNNSNYALVRDKWYGIECEGVKNENEKNPKEVQENEKLAPQETVDELQNLRIEI